MGPQWPKREPSAMEEENYDFTILKHNQDTRISTPLMMPQWKTFTGHPGSWVPSRSSQSWYISGFSLRWQNTNKGNLRKVGDLVMVEHIVHHGGEGMLVETRGTWLHCIHRIQEAEGDDADVQLTFSFLFCSTFPSIGWCCPPEGGSSLSVNLSGNTLIDTTRDVSQWWFAIQPDQQIRTNHHHDLRWP